jgi:hypothetical protein
MTKYFHQKSLTIYFSIVFLTNFFLGTVSEISAQNWRVHDWNRPRPEIVDPGTFSTQDQPGSPPSDATVLFDGQDISKWRSMEGGPAKWIVKNGYMESVKGSGYVRTYQNFGDCQLHVEFVTPTPPEGTSQGRGNSGVFLMGKYEVQVLDSYDNVTYADGQCSSIYGQYPPLVNASRKPGEWQIYDIIFHGPQWDREGNLKRKARITVFHNGVLTQNNVEIWGPTDWLKAGIYSPESDKGYLSLQDHGNPVRYRNIWIRELGQKTRTEVTVSPQLLKMYAGEYKIGRSIFPIKLEDGKLVALAKGGYWVPLFAESDTKFYSKELELEIEFKVKDGAVTGLTRRLTGSSSEATRNE